jgi:hypothetical protein
MEEVINRFRDLEEVDANSDDSDGLNVLFLADNLHSAGVVQDHIQSIVSYSSHKIFIINPIRQSVTELPFRKFDVVLIHYSIFILSEYFLSEKWKYFIKKIRIPVIQIIQDEYRSIDLMKKSMSQLGVKAVLSSLSKENLSRVYGGDELSNALFYSCLPGYFTDHLVGKNVPKIEDRPLDIIYRGRNLPYALGRFPQDKNRIGRQVKDLAQIHGFKIDIEWDEEKRIYGEQWIEFLTSGRCCLAVEGGASIFDFKGEIQSEIDAFVQDKADVSFTEVWESVLKKYEGNIVHRTITPRIFEAISLRTALILYPGDYRGLLKAGIHYIELRPDGSNVSEVVQSIEDREYLQRMVDITYLDLATNKKLHFRSYVGQVDKIMSSSFVVWVKENGRLAEIWVLIHTFYIISCELAEKIIKKSMLYNLYIKTIYYVKYKILR